MNTKQTALIGLTCALVAVACQKKPVQLVPQNVRSDALPPALPDSLIQRDRWAHAPGYATSPFLRGIVAVHFNPDATTHDRELALRSVNGFVVARTPLGSGEALYYLKLVVDRPDTVVFRAIRILRQNPAVRNATPEIIVATR
jgi:hypothetical protein